LSGGKSRGICGAERAGPAKAGAVRAAATTWNLEDGNPIPGLRHQRQTDFCLKHPPFHQLRTAHLIKGHVEFGRQLQKNPINNLHGTQPHANLGVQTSKTREHRHVLSTDRCTEADDQASQPSDAQEADPGIGVNQQLIVPRPAMSCPQSPTNLEPGSKFAIGPSSAIQAFEAPGQSTPPTGNHASHIVGRLGAPDRAKSWVQPAHPRQLEHLVASFVSQSSIVFHIYPLLAIVSGRLRCCHPPADDDLSFGHVDLGFG
jgi:hypothetical protein